MKIRAGARSGRRKSTSRARLAWSRAVVISDGEAGPQGDDHGSGPAAGGAQVGQRQAQWQAEIGAETGKPRQQQTGEASQDHEAQGDGEDEPERQIVARRAADREAGEGQACQGHQAEIAATRPAMCRCGQRAEEGCRRHVAGQGQRAQREGQCSQDAGGGRHQQGQRVQGQRRGGPAAEAPPAGGRAAGARRRQARPRSEPRAARRRVCSR